MWDKAVLRRTERARGVTSRDSGAESPDWRSREAGQPVDTGTSGSAQDSSHRVEIQQDGTMAVVSTCLAGVQDVELGGGLRPHARFGSCGAFFSGLGSAGHRECFGYFLNHDLGSTRVISGLMPVLWGGHSTSVVGLKKW
ncbi:hypothetical protein NDU88_008941 [Pleurodeles waltl]|uniref:Uncharacterized protein n=1 Tax=Pleurodeles waltl TaxID=8319 RepID=A0AAV7QR96_PLEWA|nr:hypothetical protein NDU88_008941 [Pleurodeles waltl]